MATASSPSPVPPVVAGNLPFPADLQFPRGAIGPDMVVGGEAWHRPLPADWVPIIARDIQRQAEQEEQVRENFIIYRVIPIHTPVYIWIAEVKGE